MRLITFLIRNI